MNFVFVLCLLVVCTVRQGEGTVKDYLNEISNDIGHAISVAWNSVIDAIKRPVRTKRIGPSNAKRRTPTPNTTTEIPFPDEAIPLDIATASSGTKLSLPFLRKPSFRSMDEWQNMQKPRFASRIRISSTPETMIFVGPTKYERRKLDDDGYYGPLMFI